jgi:hypothetical protein
MTFQDYILSTNHQFIDQQNNLFSKKFIQFSLKLLLDL